MKNRWLSDLVLASRHGRRLSRSVSTRWLRNRRRELLGELVASSGWTVLHGLFAGLTLSDEISWAEEAILPRLLGTYESEVQDALRQRLGMRYSHIVDIGCAEGYYAVGLARLFPDATVWALDIDPAALSVTRNMAQANGVEGRVHTALSDNTWTTVREKLALPGRKLLVSDIEGSELQLFEFLGQQEIASTDCIIECHERAHQGLTKLLREKLMQTHKLSVVRQGSRGFPPHAGAASWNEFEYLLAVWEGRKYIQEWLVAEAPGRDP